MKKILPTLLALIVAAPFWPRPPARRAKILCSFLAFGFAACGPESCCAPPAAAAGRNLAVTNGAVRACTALLLLDGDEVPGVAFSPDVRGESVPEAPRVAVAFTAREDVAISGGNVLTLEYRGAPGLATLVNFECTDAAGNDVPDALRIVE